MHILFALDFLLAWKAPKIKPGSLVYHFYLQDLWSK